MKIPLHDFFSESEQGSGGVWRREREGRQRWPEVVEVWVVACGGGGAATTPDGGLALAVAAAHRG
jgi:hypothetical protein